METISVIVPVYNCENYLDRCICSVLNQTYTNWELLLVDDGSTDASSRMCDTWAEKDKHIQAIHKKNGGTASARNYGIEIAKGEYISFLDNDDWYEPQFLEKLYALVVAHRVKLASCNVYVWSSDKRTIRWPIRHEGKISSYEEVSANVLYNKSQGAMIWNMLLHKSILQKQKFPNKYYEDVAVWYKFYFYAGQCACTDEPLYNYDKRISDAKTSRNITRLYFAFGKKEHYFWICKYGPYNLKEQALNVYFWSVYDALANCTAEDRRVILFYWGLFWARLDYMRFCRSTIAEQYKIQGKALLKGYKNFLKCREEHGYY